MNGKSGKVYLIGAGPGDYRLLTLKACDCLKMADTVVYDRLADERILQYAPRDAEFIYVGKASSQHTMTQDKICQLLVDLAKEGKTVVRLKGGDPFVFGRGGEEALLLQENGLPFEIVPGVTSAISVPAYAGIPVTHRGVAASFAVVTGHEDPTKENSDINWQQLATATDTVVFLMGVANLPKITARLMENGRSGDTPVAIIRWGTKAQQQVWTSTVAEAADLVKSESIKPPCIFLVGNVVKLREKLAWFDNPKLKPLFCKRVLVTRARAQASLLAEKLETLGAACTEAPAIRIQPPADGFGALDKAIGELDAYNWLIFTSANGVNYFFDRLLAAGRDSRGLGRAKVCAIGSATAKALKGYGIIADVVPAEFRAEGILAALEGKVGPGDKVLLPRAAEARNILPEELGRKGIDVTVVPAYETVAGEADGAEIRRQLSQGEIDVITFTSSSTVKNLAKILGEDAAELINSTRTAAIGPVTAATCREQGIRVDIEAKEYTIDGLVDGLVEALS
ncbi:MAG: uroporphyrinogen-III C-methyltransferase [Anaerovibrio sp.]|nr:uroporphyrinogen-III C-methyltransferase [Anaerovibrio sp.]